MEAPLIHPPLLNDDTVMEWLRVGERQYAKFVPAGMIWKAIEFYEGLIAKGELVRRQDSQFTPIRPATR